MTKKVFIDGAEGTTGLQVYDRLKNRIDIEIVNIEDNRRKDLKTRLDLMTKVDLTIQCLPDSAALEINSLLKNEKVRLIDSSSAHRVHPDFVYGFQEMTESQKDKIFEASFVSNPGCYPTAFIAMIRPLVENKLISSDTVLTVPSVSGYSGGGKKLIKEFETDNSLNYALYGLNFTHKHLPEMKKFSKLSSMPIFLPSVGNFYQGMLVNVPLHSSQFLNKITSKELIDFYRSVYSKFPLIKVTSLKALDQKGFLFPDTLNRTDCLEILVFSDSRNEQFTISARLDNLGKGAAGAAIQNLNIMLNFDPYEGLRLTN